MRQIDVYVAGDYAGMTCDRFEFYYGYEQTCCRDHAEEDCQNCEWAFVAKEGGKEVMRLGFSAIAATPDQFDVTTNLLAGIGSYILARPH